MCRLEGENCGLKEVDRVIVGEREGAAGFLRMSGQQSLCREESILAENFHVEEEPDIQTPRSRGNRKCKAPQVRLSLAQRNRETTRVTGRTNQLVGSGHAE